MRIVIPFLLLMAVLLAAFFWRSPRQQAELTTINSVSVRNIDPQRISWSHDVRLGYALFEGLFTYDAQSMQLRPGVAEDFSLGDDHLTYTFHLRHDARWSDGQPVTADDFLFAWRTGLMPENAADYSDFFMFFRGATGFAKWAADSLAALKQLPDAQRHAAAEKRLADSVTQFNRLVGARAPDPHTLIVTLGHPVAYFKDLLAFPTLFPLPHKTIERFTHIDPQTGAAQRSPQWTKAANIVGNGPLQLVRWRFKQDLYLVPNPHYWNAAAVKLHSLRIVNIENYNTAFLAYQTGAVNLFLDASPLNVAPELLDQAARGERHDVHSSDWFGTYYYLFNCRPTLANGKPNPLADPDVRRALALCVDKTAIVTHVTRLRQTVAYSLIPPGTINGYTPPRGHDLDIAEARRLLAGKHLPPIELLYNTGGGHENIAQAVKQMWERDLGLQIETKGQELKVAAERVDKGDFMIARRSWIGDYPDPTTFLDLFATDGSNNVAQFSDAAYDALLAKAAKTLDPDERMALLQQAEQRLLDLQPIIPIYHYKIIYLYDPARIHGVSLHPRGTQFYGQMYVTPPKAE